MNEEVASVKGVGDQVAKKLAVLGVKTVHDLIYNFPRRYEDYSVITPISKIRPGPITIQGQIKQASGRYVRRGMHITEAVASDSSGSVRLVWFNQPYRAAAIKKGETYFVSGNFEMGRGRLSIMNSSMELVKNFPLSTARIVPVYRETKGLKSATIRKVIAGLRQQISDLPETLPKEAISQNGLISRSEAVLAMHFPNNAKQLEAAKRRLGFEEVFALTLAALIIKQANQKVHALRIPFKQDLAQNFVKKLPFKLTDAQRKVIWQIYKDLAGKTVQHAGLSTSKAGRTASVSGTEDDFSSALLNHRTQSTDFSVTQGENRLSTQMRSLPEYVQPMNRLIEGDVGSGKTVVAAMAAMMAVAEGYQVALMAPTELLARQHAESLHELMKPVGLQDSIALLVGSLAPAAKKQAHLKIASGEAKFIIGTHAVISEKVDMQGLGLIIVDEQHRFGVAQRAKLQKKAGHMPHLLSMTATPIPRTLALTVYGELDISLLDDMPPGRKPVITKIVSPNSKQRLHEKIDKELEAGKQMFVVCPLITESDALKALSAEEVYKDFTEHAFKHRKVGLLHGKMKSDDKEKIMNSFASGKLDILVATTVIEVGVNVPNASIMLVEGAERFGLAQIHQLRGRVGRSSDQGYCYLIMSDNSAPTRRLRAIEQSTDGFRLAELDLEIRGPGAIYGHMQHGQLDLRIANLADTRLISAARASAQNFLDSDEKLSKYPDLEVQVKENQKITSLN